MTTTSKSWRRRNGFGAYWELPLVIALLITGIIVFDTTGSRTAAAGLTRAASFALSIAGVLATCVSFFSFVGLLTTIELLRSPLVDEKNWSMWRTALVVLLACLTTSLPVYFTLLWLADI